MITIRKGTLGDLDRIMDCYDAARDFMRSTGNKSQWINGYPSRKVVTKDIMDGNNYVGFDSDRDLVMTFAFILGDDPTYTIIHEGKWLNDDPYGTIHRIGSTGKHHGILRECVRYCEQFTDNIRLDTHADNKTMQAAARRLAFTLCGIIHCYDGTPRLAFHRPPLPNN